METSLFILALSKTLPESCLQGVIVYLFLQLLLAVFKKSTPALRFNLFYAASVLLFFGFSLNLFQHYNQVRTVVADNNFTISQNLEIAIVALPNTNLWQQITVWTNHYAYTIASLYIIGLVFCVLRLIIGLININWFKKSGQLQQENNWSEKVKILSTHFNLVKTVSVFLSNKIQVPFTIGSFKPIIVFPIALVNQLTIEQTEAILLHELAHIKRADYLLNILLGVIQSFLFFNPIIWLLGREINKYREQCCDDLVLDKTTSSIAYAQALFQIETYRGSQLALALAFNGKKYTLLNRIKRITNMEINNPSPQNKLVVLLLALITIGISVAWNMPVKKVIKHLAEQHFKVIKEASVTSNSQAVPIKTALITNDKSYKKLNLNRKRKIFDFYADTTIKSKNKFKIVLEDSTGNKKEYNSVEELPADAQKEFLKENRKLNKFQDFNFSFKFPDSNKLAFNNKFYSSAEWKKQAAEMRKQGEALRKQFNSPAWKKQQEEMRKQIQKQFDSPEWKKQMADIKIQGEEIRKQFDSPEWKKQMENIKIQSEEISKQFNSPEWKKQMEDLRLQSKQMGKQGEEMRKYYNSPEWKKQQQKIQKEIEKSQKAWKKSYDEQPKTVIPEKPTVPEEL